MQRNRLEVLGFLATKPTVRYLPSGTPVANVRLGESYRYQDGDDKPQQHTNWHNLSFYGDLSRAATALPGTRSLVSLPILRAASGSAP